ncbi:hypothetical protein JTB14_017193 [Gonioctena quinquepunctata]|nr:hypothetical protein JTB14_017193 [Gonioctena quinquepunctata]
MKNEQQRIENPEKIMILLDEKCKDNNYNRRVANPSQKIEPDKTTNCFGVVRNWISLVNLYMTKYIPDNNLSSMRNNSSNERNQMLTGEEVLKKYCLSIEILGWNFSSLAYMMFFRKFVRAQNGVVVENCLTSGVEVAQMSHTRIIRE